MALLRRFFCFFSEPGLYVLSDTYGVIFPLEIGLKKVAIPAI